MTRSAFVVSSLPVTHSHILEYFFLLVRSLTTVFSFAVTHYVIPGSFCYMVRSITMVSYSDSANLVDWVSSPRGSFVSYGHLCHHDSLSLFGFLFSNGHCGVLISSTAPVPATGKLGGNAQPRADKWSSGMRNSGPSRSARLGGRLVPHNHR
jgi:hypothetical protein